MCWTWMDMDLMVIRIKWREWLEQASEMECEKRRWKVGKLKRERFINYVNGFHHALKFTWEISETCVLFLDISVSAINGDALATSVSFKPTDSHSYLLISSSHPKHTEQSLTPNFCPFAAMTKILRPNLWKWEPFLSNVAIPPIY